MNTLLACTIRRFDDSNHIVKMYQRGLQCWPGFSDFESHEITMPFALRYVRIVHKSNNLPIPFWYMLLMWACTGYTAYTHTHTHELVQFIHSRGLADFPMTFSFSLYLVHVSIPSDAHWWMEHFYFSIYWNQLSWKVPHLLRSSSHS